MTIAFRSAVLGLTAACALATAQALAADATPEGAAKLTESLQKYLGKPAAGETSGMAVTPKGADYQVTFDLQRAFKPLAALGLGLDASPVEFALTDLGDGTWHIVSSSFPQITMRMPPNQTMDLHFEGVKTDGIFDTKTAIFRNLTQRTDKVSSKVSGGGSTQIQTYGPNRLDYSAENTGADAANVTLKQVSQNFSQEVDFMAPDKDGKPSGPAMHVSAKASSFEVGASIGALRATKMMELWAFFVAHPSLQAIADSQADLKALLRDSGPVLEKFSENFGISDLGIVSPAGTLGLKSMAAAFDIDGIGSGGSVGLSLKGTGLTLPARMIPAWGAGFVPSLVDLAPRLTGLNFSAAAREAVQDFDLHKSSILTGADTTKIAFLLAPGGSFKVTLPKGRVTSALLDITLDGAMDVTVPKASGKLNVHAKGVDAAIDALKAGMATDKSAAQAFGLLTVAKGLGKAEADGGMLWVVDLAQDGSTSVNGTPLAGPKP